MFDRRYCMLWVGNGLMFGRIINFVFVIIYKSYYRRGSLVFFIVRDNYWFVFFYYCYVGVGGFEVNIDNFIYVIICVLLILNGINMFFLE